MEEPLDLRLLLWKRNYGALVARAGAFSGSLALLLSH